MKAVFLAKTFSFLIRRLPPNSIAIERFIVSRLKRLGCSDLALIWLMWPRWWGWLGAAIWVIGLRVSAKFELLPVYGTSFPVHVQ